MKKGGRAKASVQKPTEKRKEGKLIIGHYPSNALVKGTKEIKALI